MKKDNLSLSLDYAWEKMFVAVLTLATGESSLRERMVAAYAGSLIRLRPEDFPDENLRQQFIDIQEEIAPPGGNCHAVISAWPDIDIQRIAKMIVSLYDNVARRYPPD